MMAGALAATLDYEGTLEWKAHTRMLGAAVMMGKYNTVTCYPPFQILYYIHFLKTDRNLI